MHSLVLYTTPDKTLKTILAIGNCAPRRNSSGTEKRVIMEAEETLNLNFLRVSPSPSKNLSKQIFDAGFFLCLINITLSWDHKFRCLLFTQCAVQLHEKVHEEVELEMKRFILRRHRKKREASKLNTCRFLSFYFIFKKDAVNLP